MAMQSFYDGQVLYDHELAKGIGCAMGTALNFIFDGATSTSQENLYYDNDNSDIDTTNTTAYYFTGNNNVYCASTGTAEEAVFDDGTSLAKWTQATDGSGGSATIDITTSPGDIYMYVSSTVNSVSYASITEKSTYTNMFGKTLIIYFDLTTVAANPPGDHFSFEVRLGGVTIKSVSSVVTYTNYKWKIIPKSGSTTSVTVYEDTGGGYGAGADVNISAATADHLPLSIYMDAHGAGGGPCNVTAKLHTMWVDNYKASIFQTDQMTISSSTAVMSLPKDVVSNTGCRVAAIYYSDDGGSTWSSSTARGEIFRINPASTDITIKYDMVYSNATPSAMLTTIQKAWGMYYG